MKSRITETALVVLAFVVLISVAIAEHPHSAASTYSSYDTAPNGYRALYEVLRREGVPVDRFESQLGLLPSGGVLVITSTQPERDAGLPYQSLDLNDVQRLKTFAQHGRVLLFLPEDSPLAVAARRFSTRLDPAAYTNTGLAASPQAAARIYALVSGRGAVRFDERVHGYVRDQSFWSALPGPVHAAVWLLAVLGVLIVVEQNFPIAPPIAIDPPSDRDSSSYIRSMAALLRRGHAGPAAVARFAHEAALLSPHARAADGAQQILAELNLLSAAKTVSDRTVLHAAQLYATIRKER